MKVCHMVSVRDSYDLCAFQRECLSLAKTDYEIYLVAAGESREDRGVHVVGVGEMPAGRLKRMLLLTRRIYQKALELDADLYQIHDPELLPYALRLKRRGKKVIFDCHELYTVLLRSKYYLPCARQAAWLYGCYEKYVMRRIDAVVFVGTRDGKDPFEGVSRRTVMVANYAMKHELYDRYVPVEKQTPAMCFVGIMSPDRGAENMVVAAEKSGVKLILVGALEPEEYDQRVRSMPEWRNVDFRGILDRERVFDVFQEATIGMCVIPNGGQYNICDTFNMKVYDYMAMGLPVVLSDSAYARQVMERYEFGILVDPADTDQITGAIRYLADHPEEAARMGQAGRRAIDEVFNWETQVQKLLALYRDLIGPPEEQHERA